MKKPLLAITLGDPAGIGPRVGALAAADPRVRRLCRPLLVGDAWVLHKHFFHPTLRVRPIAHPDDILDRPGLLNVLHVPHPAIRSLVLGRPQKVGGEAAALAVRTAVGLALQKRVAAIVTGPLSKESLRLAGIKHPGHTEMLAALSGARRVEMLMGAGNLRTVLITRHIPLKDVPRLLSKNNIVKSIRLIDPWLKRALRIKGRPRWAVCGLNPHAGDNGLLGREEKRIIAPAVLALRAAGVDATGPLPADVAWAKHAGGQYDAVGCLYHDQGMIPLKTLFPQGVVNVTVGLPFVRTSAGHGTAFDLAADHPAYRRADPAPSIEACLWALRISKNLRNT